MLKVGARDGEAIPSRTKLTKIDAHELNEINLSDRVLWDGWMNVERCQNDKGNYFVMSDDLKGGLLTVFGIKKANISSRAKHKNKKTSKENYFQGQWDAAQRLNIEIVIYF